MKPHRPDSAKSAKTRITIDSEISSNNLTTSKFSQTYSNGVKLNGDKNNDFHKYMAQKNKDPRFKKLLENNLPQIPENQKPPTQMSKLNSKPFQRKISKNQKEKIEKKVEQPPKKIEQQLKETKKQNLQTSKTFMDKSKQKLKLSSGQNIKQFQSNGKIQQKNQNLDNGNQQTNAVKPKISLNGFVLNIPGKAPQVIKQQKKAQKKVEQPKQNKEKSERQKLMTELSEYVRQIQERNIDYLPKRYDQFIDKHIGNKEVDLQKINIQQFLDDPNERDYDTLMKKINRNEYALQSNQKNNNSSISVNLQQIIDGSSKKDSQLGQNEDDKSVIMSSMSASDIRDRNMFLTQILKGKRLTHQQVNQIKQNDETIAKLIKLEGTNKQQQLDQQQVEIMEINMNKKKHTRIMQRNKVEAAGELYRQCDYLTPQQQQRIEDLINGVKIQSPFEFSQMESFMNRRIDQGIKLHRQLCRDIQGQPNSQIQITIDQQMLPKDPILRKNAQLKILRQKINLVNSRLSNLNEIVVNKNKIQNLINKYKEVIKPSKMSESLVNQKNKQIQQQCKKLKEAEEILSKMQNQKDQILQTLQYLSKKFETMEADIVKIQKMDVQQRRQLERKQLNLKRKRIEQVEKQAKQFQKQLEYMAEVSEDFKRKTQILDQIMASKNEKIVCEGYKQGQTIDELDQLITKKWQAAEDAVRLIRNQENS